MSSDNIAIIAYQQPFFLAGEVVEVNRAGSPSVVVIRESSSRKNVLRIHWQSTGIVINCHPSTSTVATIRSSTISTVSMNCANSYEITGLNEYASTSPTTAPAQRACRW